MKRLLVLLSTLLVLYFIAELVQTVQYFFSISPLFGYISAVIIGLLVLLLALQYFKTLFALRKASPPPEFQDSTNPTDTELKHYLAFLRKRVATLTARAAEKPNIPALFPEPEADEPNAAYLDRLKAGINEAVAPLDKQAEEEIIRTVRDVLLGVMFSPVRSLDVFIVLYKNYKLVAALSRIYDTKPDISVQFKIMRDIIAIAVTLNVMNLSDKFIEKLLSNVPGLQGSADDVVQGVGAGFFTSVIGFTAKSRCRNLEPWSVQEQQQTIKNNFKSIMRIIKNIIFQDAGPRLRNLFPNIKDLPSKLVNTLEQLYEGGKESLFRTGRGSKQVLKKVTSGIGGKVTSLWDRQK
jgi:uncharacterized membrane protein YcjF (UPF0283 family)